MTLQPFPAASERASMYPIETPIETRPDEQRRRPQLVLLVEDEPFVREATGSILESAGFEVLTATDADHALKVYQASPRPIDLVMTDMILPGRTGRQLGDELRERCPNLAVLITSGYSQAECSVEAPQSRTYFLAKPYSRRGLIAKIEQIFLLPSRALPFYHASGKVG